MSAPKKKDRSSPGIRTAQIRMLERLCNAAAVSGDEGEVRAIVLEQLRPHADEVKVDAIGNVLVTRLGQSKTGARGSRGRRLRVMLAAHMDEVGFMITHDDGDGIFRFDIVGGLDERQLVGKPVRVGRKNIPAVIGAKPIHLTSADERRRSISLDNLRIDIGAGGGNEVMVGDRAVFATSFARVGPSLRAKALDDRLGVAILIEMVKNAPSSVDLLAAFTVQEEVGLRGAGVAAYALAPDVAFAIDSTPAMDLPAWEHAGEPGEENTHYNTRLDKGPAIYIADGATLSDPRLVRHLIDTAERLDIPYQIRQPGGGGTDAGAIHRARAGIPSVSVSVPSRYAHTAVGIARLSDWQNTLALIHAAVASLAHGVLAAGRG